MNIELANSLRPVSEPACSIMFTATINTAASSK